MLSLKILVASLKSILAKYDKGVEFYTTKPTNVNQSLMNWKS